MWREHAEPLASLLHEVAAVDEEINAANRLKLGAWIDKVETVARPGVGDIDTHKLVGLHTRLPPWSHDEHRVRRTAVAAAAAEAQSRGDGSAERGQLDEAVAAEAKEAMKVWSQLEEVNRLSRQRRKVLGGSW